MAGSDHAHGRHDLGVQFDATTSLDNVGSIGSARNERFELPGRQAAGADRALSLQPARYRLPIRWPQPGSRAGLRSMVSFVVEQVSGQRLPHAAKIAARTRPIPRGRSKPATWCSSIHRGAFPWASISGTAVSSMHQASRGKVRWNLDNRYFATRFDGAGPCLERTGVRLDRGSDWGLYDISPGRVGGSKAPLLDSVVAGLQIADFRLSAALRCRASD